MRLSAKVIGGFMRKEFSQTLRDPVMRVFLFVAPVIQLTMFGYAISTEFRNLKYTAFFTPGDAMMRRLTGSFHASRYFTPVTTDGENDPEALIRSGKADLVLVAPREGLTRAAGRGTPEIQLLIDATNATKARSVENYARQIILKFFMDAAPGQAPPPVSFDVRVLYNPTLETSWFMVPGVMTMIICIVTVMLTGMSIAREKELGTLETIIAAPIDNREVILGKTIPFVVLGLADALLVIGAGTLIFGVPVRGPLILMLLASLVFVFTTVSAGTLISTFSRNQQQAMMGSFLFVFPATLMSGIMFPVENMPAAMKVIAYLNPLQYFASLLRAIMLKGTVGPLVWFDLAALCLMAAVIMHISVKRFNRTVH